MGKAKIWTHKGLSDLGQWIRASRVAQGMDLRAAADLITRITPDEKITFTALGRIEKAAVMPTYNKVAAIQAAGFVVDRNNKPLSIYDFIDIASETYLMDSKGMEVLIQLISTQLKHKGITLEKFAEEAMIELNNLERIMRGERTEDFVTDLIFLSPFLIDPRTSRRFTGYVELVEYCNIDLDENPVPNSEQDSHVIDADSLC